MDVLEATRYSDAVDIDFDAAITLEEAAVISGLEVSTLRAYAHRGTLRTQKMGARLTVTTRRWLHEYLVSRNQEGPGQRPKPLPTDYVAPPRRRRGRTGELKLS